MPSTQINYSLALALVLTACSAVSIEHLSAGEFNQVLSIGDKTPGWERLPAADDRSYASSDFADAKVLVIAFTCNTCPYAVDHEQRLKDFVKRFSSEGVMLVAINPNAGRGDQLEVMKERATDGAFNFPYLRDESQELAEAFGAAYTPEFFVLDQERRVAYMGAMDDSPDGSNVTKRYVEDAVHALLQNTVPTIRETVPIGCRIRMTAERKRKSRQSR